jgi:hypothetical protein
LEAFEGKMQEWTGRASLIVVSEPRGTIAGERGGAI